MGLLQGKFTGLKTEIAFRYESKITFDKEKQMQFFYPRTDVANNSKSTKWYSVYF